jgi:uncharacterized membrane protein YhfC
MPRKTPESPRATLATNLADLMGKNSGLSSALLIEKATKGAIGHSTVARMKAGSNATLDNVQALAALFNLEAWQLLHPTLGVEEEAELSVEIALSVLVQQLQRLDDDARDLATSRLHDLAKSPDSRIQMRSVLAALGGAPREAEPLKPKVVNE